MRRIISLVLALAVALSIALGSGFSVSADEPTEAPDGAELAASDECINILKKYEGFSSKPYQDYGQWTVGYGTRCPDDKLEHYKANGITEAEAEELLKKYISGYNNAVNNFADRYDLTMTQGQFDALVLFSFNCGSGWTSNSSQNFHQTIAKGSAADPKDVLYWFATWSNAGGSPLTALIRRRLAEANMYLNGLYSTAAPENYNFVIYTANGGSLPSRIHAYDTTAEPVVPTYSGHSFLGWYTAKTGGTKVTLLDEAVDGMTLYARWDDVESGDEETGDPAQDITPVKITVTSNNVNLRKGPGTNYATVGQANKNDQYVISQIAEGSGHTWGNFSTGWIALTYTDYEQVKDQPSVEPDPTQPEPTEPEVTEPEPTEPEVTEPETTEPEVTEPEPTQPEQPQGTPGKVKANGGLNIRSGPGTGYSVAGQLENGAAVMILDQKSVGSMIWGQISQGWISMSYVVLDTPDQDQPQPETGGNDQSDGITGYIKAIGGLNIRSGPGSSHKVVGAYSNGAKVTVTQQQSDGSVTWGKTSRGWISMTYFTTDTPGNGGSDPQPEGVAGTVKVNGMLCIRSGAGTTYAVQGYYKNSDRVTITQQQKVGATTWGQTSKGWISMDYVVLDDSGSQGTEPAKETRTVSDQDGLNVRGGAGTGYKIVGFLPYGTKVEILEKTTVDGVLWGKISQGWICLKYTAE